MENKHLIEDVQFLLDEAEERMWRRTRGVMMDLYWQIGYCLREYSEQDLLVFSEELAIILDIDGQMLRTAYRFYKDNPLKKKVMRWCS
ncbi:hypothetical protein EXS74_02885 [Candidatus Woesearchaeota archaeon]|nr:hypothetical protein [Candidatus Woesearchaeota archaeon]